MLHITKQKNGYAVASVGENGELLSITETLTKQNCWKNVIAQSNNFPLDIDDAIEVQDDTLKVPKVFYVRAHNVRVLAPVEPNPIYIPGKNTKSITSKIKTNGKAK